MNTEDQLQVQPGGSIPQKGPTQNDDFRFYILVLNIPGFVMMELVSYVSNLFDHGKFYDGSWQSFVKDVACVTTIFVPHYWRRQPSIHGFLYYMHAMLFYNHYC
jgi:hypothetical protein